MSSIDRTRFVVGMGAIALGAWLSWPWLFGIPVQLEWQPPPEPVGHFEVCIDTYCTPTPVQTIAPDRYRAATPRVRPGTYVVGARACGQGGTCSPVTTARVRVEVVWEGLGWREQVIPGP